MLLATLALLSCGDKEAADSDSQTATTDTDPAAEDTGPFDEDQDGHRAGDDCDDDDPSIYPGAPESCDGVDSDCDGLDDDDDDDAQDRKTWFADEDGDGYGTSDAQQAACDQPDGYSDNSEDCDDTDPTVNPGATDTRDGVDTDCDGEIDDDWDCSAEGGTLIDETISEFSTSWSSSGAKVNFGNISGDAWVCGMSCEDTKVTAFLAEEDGCQTEVPLPEQMEFGTHWRFCTLSYQQAESECTAFTSGGDVTVSIRYR